MVRRKLISAHGTRAYCEVYQWTLIDISSRTLAPLLSTTFTSIATKRFALGRPLVVQLERADIINQTVVKCGA